MTKIFDPAAGGNVLLIEHSDCVHEDVGVILQRFITEHPRNTRRLLLLDNTSQAAFSVVCSPEDMPQALRAVYIAGLASSLTKIVEDAANNCYIACIDFRALRFEPGHSYSLDDGELTLLA